MKTGSKNIEYRLLQVEMLYRKHSWDRGIDSSLSPMLCVACSGSVSLVIHARLALSHAALLEARLGFYFLFGHGACELVWCGTISRSRGKGGTKNVP